jgi:hypothetical protein
MPSLPSLLALAVMATTLAHASTLNPRQRVTPSPDDTCGPQANGTYVCLPARHALLLVQRLLRRRRPVLPHVAGLPNRLQQLVRQRELLRAHGQGDAIAGRNLRKNGRR